VGGGAADRCLAGLERLAKHLQYWAGEFREFVEEQHAAVGEAHLAGAGAAAAPGEGRLAGAMVRLAKGRPL